MIGDALLYLVSPAHLHAGELADLVPELAVAGVDIVQLREKELEAGDVLRLAEPIQAACRAARIPFVVNDRPDVALALGADGVHVGQNDLPPHAARRILGPDALVGLSTHATEDIDGAVSLALRGDIDYYAVGPVTETPTKPGRVAAGLGIVRYAARAEAPCPWFAIGGINASNLDAVLETGCRRIVVVRAIIEAPDPPAAAAELKMRLAAVH